MPGPSRECLAPARTAQELPRKILGSCFEGKGGPSERIALDFAQGNLMRTAPQAASGQAPLILRTI
jgi:hypothetical protein